MTIHYSIIIPVFNRPDELKELLQSLNDLSEALHRGKGGKATSDEKAISGESNPSETKSDPLDITLEVIVVEDGSEVSSKKVCSQYSDSLNLTYLYQENAGPAAARNTGAQSAGGEWLLFFDSDCIVPEGYFDAVSTAIRDGDFAFFGGPDRASAEFTATQKAIDYAMTSFLTTGGIRGGRRKLDRYYPRSFNMGIKKAAFDDVGGFSGLRFGEDLDLSMRLMSAGYRSKLIENGWVYHKRRTDLKKFFKQVYNSGMARVVLQRLHPGTMKPVHLLPSLFVCYLIVAAVSLPFHLPFILYPLGILIIILFIDGFLKTGSLPASLLVPAASVVQLSGYGSGLIHAALLIHVLGRKSVSAFEKTFYK